MSDSCANCRHHRSEQRAKDIEVGFDELIRESDEQVPFYFCRVHTLENEIGYLPILCDAFEAPKRSSRLEELDRLLAQRNRSGE